jgi:hypothetical protein
VLGSQVVHQTAHGSTLARHRSVVLRHESVPHFHPTSSLVSRCSPLNVSNMFFCVRRQHVY